MDTIDAINWRKSAKSGGNGGDCVEVADVPGLVLVRDSKEPGNGPVLRFTPETWKRFTRTLK